jgi:DNA segregation ATPase FtsK/SpoIIIE-like protein
MRPESTPELIERARRFVLEKPSISYMQRKLMIGYNHACELMEHFEDQGIVSRCDSRGQRTVLLSKHNEFNPEREYPGSYGSVSNGERDNASK